MVEPLFSHGGAVAKPLMKRTGVAEGRPGAGGKLTAAGCLEKAAAGCAQSMGRDQRWGGRVRAS